MNNVATSRRFSTVPFITFVVVLVFLRQPIVSFSCFAELVMREENREDRFDLGGHAYFLMEHLGQDDDRKKTRATQSLREDERETRLHRKTKE